MKKAFILLLLSLGIQSLFAADDLKNLLPDTASFNSLSILQKPTVYEGFDLFTMIDGGAEIYFEYGFEKALSAAYLIQQTERLEIQIYLMTDAGAAYGIFSHTRLKSDEIIFTDSTLTISSEYYHVFQKGKYFIVLSWSQPSSDLSDLGVRIAKEIGNKIGDPLPFPNIVTHYLQKGYDFSQLKYIRGQIALSSVYFFSNKDMFNLREAIYIEDESTKLIYFNYLEEEESYSQFQMVKEELSNSKRIIDIESSEDTLQFSDKRGREINIKPIANIIVVSISQPSSTEKTNSALDGF